MTTFKDYPFYLLLSWSGLVVFLVTGGLGLSVSELLRATDSLGLISMVFLYVATATAILMFYGLHKFKFIFPIGIYLLTAIITWGLSSTNIDPNIVIDHALQASYWSHLNSFLFCYGCFFCGEKIFSPSWRKITSN